MQHFSLRVSTVSGLLIASFVLPAMALQEEIGALPEGTTAFKELDDIRGEWVTLNAFPVRPMAATPDFSDVYAVNTHDSTVLHFTDYAGAPAATHRVPWSPVSIALWDDPGALSDPGRLLVVCRGNYSLVTLRASDGAIVDLLPLPAEPSDILVDQGTGRAFVSCSATDDVVEIDLVTSEIAHTYAIPSEHPLFLSWDGSDVLVTPMLSGNNSVVHKAGDNNLRPGPLGILDLTGGPNPALTPLPDEDVFRIQPGGGPVTAVATGLGTILFGHGVNPITGELWVLGTEARNKDASKQTESAIRGEFSENRVAYVDLQSGSANIVDIDGDPIDPSKTVGQPFSVTFIPPGEPGEGFGWVTGLLTDNVMLLDHQGQQAREIDLTPGAIPRGVLIDTTHNRILVYCWGTNQIELYGQLTSGPLLGTLDLGFDPAPAIVQDGRAVFYDASHSRDANASCATCHVEGRTDLEEWNLSNLPQDDKGPLTTQTLAGIDRVRTFHWRGEQGSGLIDFNAAFDKLLGGTPLDTTPGGEFDQFRAFVLSIQSPANPNAAPRRVVSASFAPDPPVGMVPGDPIEGQRIWFEEPRVANFTCNQCHNLPTGTNNDITTDGRGQAVEQGRLLVTGFNELWRKDQAAVVPVTFDPNGTPGGTQLYSRTGAGLSHAGGINTLFDFADLILVQQEALDVHSFLHQLDSGMAPAVHEAILLDVSTVSSAGRRITKYLLPQADKGNTDVAVFGTVELGGTPVELRWYYDSGSGLFHAEDTTVASQPWSFFTGQANQDQGRNTFVGMPLGMARRFAVDFDRDDLFNKDEAAHGTDPLDEDSDDDGYWDGHEIANGGDPTDGSVVPNDATAPTVSDFQVDFITTTQAKLSWTTDEPTSYVLNYDTAFHTGVVSDDSFARVRSVVLTDLLPGTDDTDFDPVLEFPYNVTLTVTDQGGNPTAVGLPGGMQTGPFTEQIEVLAAGPPKVLDLPYSVILESLDWQAPPQIDVGAGTFSGTATGRAVFKIGGPPSRPAADNVLIARVMILRANESVPEVSTTFTTSGQTSFTVNGGAAAPWPQPVVLSSISDANGQLTFSFSQDGLNAGDKVILNIEAGGPTPTGYDPTMPGTTPDFDDIARWSFADTPGDPNDSANNLRELTAAFE